LLKNIPNPLTNLFKERLQGKSTHLIDQVCEKIFQTLSFTKADQETVEITTRDQSAGNEWKNQRAWRITGTKIKRETNFLSKNDISKLKSGDI
jgi:hypothetical protein